MRDKLLLAIGLLILLSSCAYSAEAPERQVTSVNVSGNENVVSGYILNVVETKPGTVLDRETIQKDVQAIYAQGFFSYVDVDITPEGGGSAVTFTVRENPKIESINFEGNTIYTSERLMEEVFSQVGTTFNSVFFRHDLDRIQDHYHSDGYLMARVADVRRDGGNIYIVIVEPKVENIVVQGNVRTKSYVIRRELKVESGDMYNATILQHNIRKIRDLGYFDDVTLELDRERLVEGVVDLIVTVKEKRTASIGLNLAYGTESGVSGGLTYSDTNIFGRGMNFEVGFNEGDEATYWATFSSPYMDSKTYAWRIGARYISFEDRYYYRQGKKQFEFDEEGLSVFAGVGKKFPNEQWSWFLTLRHDDMEYDNIREAIPGYIDDLTPWAGVNQTVEFNLTWDKRNEYAPYPTGFVWDTYLEQAVKALGGEYDYLKYWTQARLYVSLNGVADTFLDTNFPWTETNPLLLAARLRVGAATQDELPPFARYSLGGMNSLRGYSSRSFEGSNMYLGNVELRIPVVSMFSLVGFYDIGNADDHMEWDKYHDDYGVGVRVKTPFGSLRVDYAKGEDENRTYFGFGEMF